WLLLKGRTLPAAVAMRRATGLDPTSVRATPHRWTRVTSCVSRSCLSRLIYRLGNRSESKQLMYRPGSYSCPLSARSSLASSFFLLYVARWSSSSPGSSLLIAQRDQRIDLCRPASGHKTGDQSFCPEQQWRHREYQWIGRADGKKET